MPTSKAPIAVRNVILISGHDHEGGGRSFDEPALARILEIFDQGEHLRYPIRFHLLSAVLGIAAESVVFDRSYQMPKEEELRALRFGKFWLRVDPRFAPVSKEHYGHGKVFSERAPAEKRAPGSRDRQPPEKRVLSITDVYRYLYSFWEGAQNTSPKDLVAFDSILELSFFSHASVDSVMLVNSVDRRSRSRSRDPQDKDARAKDFTGFSGESGASPGEFWGRISRMFDRAAGRVRIWGSDPVGDTPFYAALIRAAHEARRRTESTALPHATPEPSDADPVPVEDPRILDRLGKDAARLTLGGVKAILAGGLAASYASAAQKALGVAVHAAPLGAVTAPEQKPAGEKRRLLFAVPRSFDDIVRFHTETSSLALDREGRRYGVLGRAPRVMPEDKDATSPLAGVQLFTPYPYPFRLDPKTGEVVRDPALGRALDKVLESSGFDYENKPLEQPAIAIADVTSAEPFPYAATKNDAAVYYSGSLLKVAAVLSAARLRNVADVAGLDLEDLAPRLSPTIARAIDFSRTIVLRRSGTSWVDAKLAWEHRVPRYEALLFRRGARWEINGTQAQNIEDIFTDRNHRSNVAAEALVHGLGYAWIDATTRYCGLPGIWLAGDYSGGARYPSAKIAANNDFLSAQATTARDMTAMFALLARNGSPEMEMIRREWLSKGGSWFKQEVERSESLKARFQVLGAKVGLGVLEPHPRFELHDPSQRSIYSEGAIISDTQTKRTFAVVWQNTQVDDISTVLRTIREVLITYKP